MLELAIFVAVLGTTTVIGYPACLLLPDDRFRWRFLCATPIGYGLLAVVSPILYSWGVPTAASLIAVTALGLLAMVAHLALRPRPAISRQHVALAGGILVVMLLCLLPAWTGGSTYTVFQGNVYDQLTYLAASASFKQFDFATLSVQSGETMLNPVAGVAGWVLRHRPSPPLVFSAYTGMFGTIGVVGVYPYLAALQANMMLAALFVFANVYNARLGTCIALSAALTLGFFQQYVFDLNSWGQLACQPIYFLMMGIVAMSFQPGRFADERLSAATRIGSLFAILLASAVYIYVEAIAIYGPAGVAAAVVALVLAWRERRAPAVTGIAALAAGSIAGLGSGLLYYTGTLHFFYGQVTILAVRGLDWWKHYQRYLFGREDNYLTILANYHGKSVTEIVNAVVSLPVEAVMGAFGLFYLLPTAQWWWGIGFAYKLLLYAFLAVLLAGVVRTVVAAFRARASDAQSAMLAACLAGVAMPVFILAAGQFWSAGKGLSMAAPLLFILLVSPLLFRGLSTAAARAASIVVVLAHVGLGVARPIAAADPTGGGVLGAPAQQEVIAGQKVGQDWRHELWSPVLRTCRHVAIDIPEPFFNRLVATVVNDLGVSWSSPQKALGWKSASDGVRMDLFDSADCLATTQQFRARDGQRLIVLADLHAIAGYVGGTSPELEFGSAAVPGVRMTGAHGLEVYIGAMLRWTSGKSRFEVPNDPKRPPRTLTLELWDVSLGPSRLTVVVDGRTLFDGPPSKVAVEMPLDGLATGETLTVDLTVTPPQSAPGDPRELGVPLKSLRLRR